MTATDPDTRLRAAAELLDQHAAAASGPRWEPEHAYGNPPRVQAVFVGCTAENGCDGVDCIHGTHGIGGFDHDPDNRWAILAGPHIAAPLAAWLRAAATAFDTWEHTGTTTAPSPVGPPAVAEALALADALLEGVA